jgi:hypothetical protein
MQFASGWWLSHGESEFWWLPARTYRPHEPLTFYKDSRIVISANSSEKPHLWQSARIWATLLSPIYRSIGGAPNAAAVNPHRMFGEGSESRECRFASLSRMLKDHDDGGLHKVPTVRHSIVTDYSRTTFKLTSNDGRQSCGE